MSAEDDATKRVLNGHSLAIDEEQHPKTPI